MTQRRICARGDADAEFPGQLGQVPVTKLKAQVPPHAGDDNVVGEPTRKSVDYVLRDIDGTPALCTCCKPESTWP